MSKFLGIFLVIIFFINYGSTSYARGNDHNFQPKERIVYQQESLERVNKAPVTNENSWLLNFIFPGMGHFFSGDIAGGTWFSGMAVLLIVVTCGFLIFEGINIATFILVLIPGSILFAINYIVSLVSGYNSSHRNSITQSQLNALKVQEDSDYRWIASLIIPGFGQALSGDWGKALLFVLIEAAAIIAIFGTGVFGSFIGMTILIPVLVLVHGWSSLDAFFTNQSRKEKFLRPVH